MALAHDAATSGERISAEAFAQFADHYFRLHQAAVGVAESKRQQDQSDSPTENGAKSAGDKLADANQANGLADVAVANGADNNANNDSKSHETKPNVGDGTKLSPAEWAKAVQGDHKGEQPA